MQKKIVVTCLLIPIYRWSSCLIEFPNDDKYTTASPLPILYTVADSSTSEEIRQQESFLMFSGTGYTVSAVNVAPVNELISSLAQPDKKAVTQG